ncbi:hypothetical protein BVI061214_00019 [Thermus aquaticus]|uniref:Uncharacterized protein n=1 Tax=Thermus aquaticus TaxID=271 RepID=A0A0N0BMN4_THEAQ|nr:hypothetical protein BVI061214_00019 [Thermus aquaticus]
MRKVLISTLGPMSETRALRSPKQKVMSPPHSLPVATRSVRAEGTSVRYLTSPAGSARWQMPSQLQS